MPYFFHCKGVKNFVTVSWTSLIIIMSDFAYVLKNNWIYSYHLLVKNATPASPLPDVNKVVRNYEAQF